MSVFYDLNKTPRNILNQAIVRAIVSENNGALFDPSDLSTLYQDAAGTIPVTAVEQPVGKMLDKSGNNWHATQPITASRPTLSARKNIMLATEAMGTQSVTSLAATYTLSFTGTGSVTLSGTATGTLTGTGTDRVSLTFTPAAGTLTLTVSGGVTKAQLELGAVAGQYQRVNTATDYDTDERYFPKYLRGDNVDDYFNLPSFNNLVTHAINENGFVGAAAETIMGSSPVLRWRYKLHGMIICEGDLSESADRRVENYLRSKSQTQLEIYSKGINDIGEAGNLGFGVGICPSVPAGYAEMDGTNNPLSQNHGNYQYADGSILCWIPAFYARVGHADNPTYVRYGVNSVSVLPVSAFADVTAANAAGYFLPRCFIDGSTIKAGFFIDKYMCSNNAGIASSIKNGNPLSSAANHNPFSGLTGAPPNNYAGAWTAAKTRGAAFFVTSRFMYAALALLSLAHGQAAISATNCAWYDAAGVINFPKGCNNNALKDTNDAAVTYTSDGYNNCGKTGSGVPFAKATHNGQNCGVADLNGLMWEISQGVTCIAVGKAITAATQANPVKLTMTAHGMTTGKELMVTGIVGMTQLNDKIYKVTVVDANNVTLDGVDGTAFTAYTSGGTGTYGTFYAAKESAVMANFTGGNTLSTDHFGAVGVAANMDAFTPACFRTDYPNNTVAQKLGNSANQVLSSELTGNNAVLRSLGVPMEAGVSTAGSNLFGQDYLFQYIRNELCLLSGANWGNGSPAGVWASYWPFSQANSNDNAGFRSACYLQGVQL